MIPFTHCHRCRPSWSNPTTMTTSSTPSTDDSQLSIHLLPRFISSLVNVPFRALSLFRSTIYNALILNMTTKWYQVVLERLEPNSTVLDIGIGTAGMNDSIKMLRFIPFLVVLEGVLQTRRHLELTLAPCLYSIFNIYGDRSFDTMSIAFKIQEYSCGRSRLWCRLCLGR